MPPRNVNFSFRAGCLVPLYNLVGQEKQEHGLYPQRALGSLRAWVSVNWLSTHVLGEIPAIWTIWGPGL